MKLSLALSLVLAQTNAAQLPFPAASTGHRLLTYNETTPAASLVPASRSVRWTPAAGTDGQHSVKTGDGDIVLRDVVTDSSTVLLRKSQIPRHSSYAISADTRTVLFATNSTKQYRHSSLADYTVVDTATGASGPLVEDQAGDVQLAEFSPTGDSIAFVRGNDLYLRELDGTGAAGTVHRITSDGGPDRFNAVPDWVYEEEVLGAASALWYSPDGRLVAYLGFNETGVGTFTVPFYMDGQKVAPAYPKELKLRYPKVGTTNPRVSLHVLDVRTKKTTEIPVDAFGDETIIGEVAWVTDTHGKLIYRAFNRVQDAEKHITVDTRTGASRVVRRREDADGWFENDQTIEYVGRLGPGCNGTAYYVDTSDESGWTHLYLHPVDGGRAIQLTSGDWEVRSVAKVDRERRRVAFLASKRRSSERHLYSVSWETLETTPLVDDSAPGWYDASFSPGGGYYVLSYKGPEIPYQQLLAANGTAPLRTLESNEAYHKATRPYRLPNVTVFELPHPDGFALNVRQTLPADFDPRRKYPVLFNPYGGPNSQRATAEHAAPGWTAYLASDPELRYVTFVVDGRGTGGRGRAFRSAVTRRLGALEAADQIWAARELAARLPYVDAARVAIWGTSFGGYLAGKVVEAGSGAFSAGLMGAPVTDWRLYDSVYAERYMKTLAANEAGYNRSAVRELDGFRRIAGAVAVVHGTADDNVHFQHAAALVDALVGGGVSPAKLRVMPLTDSAHNMVYNGAKAFLYRFLTARLWDEVQRKDEGGLVHQWSRRKA